ncbi:MAG TPA: hypothetical protein DEP84_23175 [Chloroflexi bacterium]|nr:hypothetical protein [Chloroflexota bacterium]
MAQELKVVGQRVPMVDAVEKVVGTAKYAGDITLPDTLHAKILRSPYPHANIKRIDIGKAEALEGVKAVLTRSSIGEIHESPIDQIMAQEKVRYVGDAVAAVAAVDVETAEKALELIEVEYEVLPAVLDAEEALRTDAPQLYEDGNRVQGFAGNPLIKKRYGDAEQALRESDVTIERSYRTTLQMNACPDLKRTLAYWEGDRLTLWSTSQGPFASRDEVAKALSVPQGKVRVICPYSGGGYGSSNKSKGQGDYRVICALLARKTGRPVSLEFTRAEEIIVGRGRVPTATRVRAGAKKDGTLTGFYVTGFGNTGAYDESGYTTMSSGSEYSYFGTYEVPTYYEMHVAFTNTPAADEFRGFGGPTLNFGCETVVDELAYEIGMDPVEFRLKNHMTAPALYGTGPTLILAANFEECLRRGAEAIGWKNKWHKPGEGPLIDGTRKRGVGVALYTKGGGLVWSDAAVKVLPDGSIQVLQGAANMGVAANTTMAQIAAEVFSVSYDNVRVVFGDTDATPFDNATNASRSAVNVGNAVKLAAEDARRKLFERAAPLLQADVKELDIEDGRIFVKGKPAEAVTVTEVLQPGKTITGLGHWDLDDPTTWTDEQLEGFFRLARQFQEKAKRLGYEYQLPELPLQRRYRIARPVQTAANFVEVEVDLVTGEVTIPEVVIAAEIGQALNPDVVEGQLEGGFTQSMGYALYEAVKLDGPTGIPLTDDWVEYKAVTHEDAPVFKLIMVESKPAGDPTTPFGVAPLGEATTVGAAPAIGNAIYNAIGVRLRELPFTPAKIRQALKTA